MYLIILIIFRIKIFLELKSSNLFIKNLFLISIILNNFSKLILKRLEDEILYGAAGYLFCLLKAKKLIE